MSAARDAVAWTSRGAREAWRGRWRARSGKLSTERARRRPRAREGTEPDLGLLAGLPDLRDPLAPRAHTDAGAELELPSFGRQRFLPLTAAAAAASEQSATHGLVDVQGSDV
jgi:hypothetical protein